VKYRLSLLAGLALACTATVRPARLNDANAVAKSASALESRELAPQAFAQAEKLRMQAAQAADEGKTPMAEMKADRAIAAYAHAQVLARIVKAEQRLVAAKSELAQIESDNLALEGRQVTVAAELASLSTQAQVEREAEAIAESKGSTPDREAARATAARSALSQARLLCVCAVLADGDAKAAEGILASISDLAASLEKKPSPSILVDALKLRSSCQEQLTLARRPNRLSEPTSDESDRLFLELSGGGYSPVRDDRGIVVILSRSDLTGKLSELARFAVEHGRSSILGVVHSERATRQRDDAPTMDALKKAFVDAGVKAVRIESAGSTLPLESGRSTKASHKNDRVEIVFVTRT